MEMTNPAVSGRVLLSPQDLEAIQEDPALMELVARGMGVINLENLFKVMQNPDITPSHKIEFQKLLNKMGRLEPVGVDTSGTGPQVVINITRAKDHNDSITIEGTALPVPDGA